MLTNIDTIKANASITKIVEHYGLTLKREGVNLKGCCPFHHEKTPSFSVSESRNLATCFGGCAESWNPVDFVIRQEGCGFIEAVRKVAGICKINLEETDSKRTDAEIEEDRKKKEQKESLYILNEAVLKFWMEKHGGFPVVSCDVATKEELLDVWGRSYRKSTLTDFGLTMAPDDNLLTKGKTHVFSQENLLHLGLIAESDGKGQYDAFRGRLIFPLWHNDQHKWPAGFAGRVHPALEGKYAKYKNSKDSLIYHKKQILYGLPQNRTAIEKNETTGGSAYLVEGYTDVLTMVDNGIPNVVATGGTALTKEHCLLLRRYAKEVIILRDADSAGRQAAMHDVEMLTEAGMVAKVLILPPDIQGASKELMELATATLTVFEEWSKKGGDIFHALKLTARRNPELAEKTKAIEKIVKVDPDKFLRKYGKTAFLALAEHPTEGIQDGILWRIREELGARPDVNTKSVALDKVGEMLAHLDSFKRSHYVNVFTKAGWFNCPKGEIEAKIGTAQVKAEKSEWNNIGPEQEHQVRKYGVYTGKTGRNKNPVYLRTPLFPQALTNFVFKPVYHIYSGSSPARKVEIVNEHGRSYIVTLPTERFTSMDKMAAEVAAYGNFIFKPECRKSDFQAIISMIYDNMETVYGIAMLGWHTAGFYTWANGITLPDGKFIPAAADGRVNHDENNFVVPGFDIEAGQKALSDEGHNVDAHIGLFRYAEGDCIDINEWVQRMTRFYADNGRMMVAWYLASLYRDIIFPEHHKGFPILNCFGPPYKGKSTAIWSLASMFGKPRPPLNVNNVTAYGLSVRHTQSRNALVNITEYKNSIEGFKIEVLKSQYDGVGRERGSVEKRNSSEQTPVNNAVTIDGQHLPTKDVALLTRCVTLEFSGYDDQPDTKTAFDEHVALENSGRLSQITSALMMHRALVADGFARALTAAKSEIRQWTGEIKEERILINHAIPLAVVKCLESVIDFPPRPDAPDIPFYEALKGFCIELVKRQCSYIDNESETSGFFRAIASLATRGMIRHGVHIMVSEDSAVTLFSEEEQKDVDCDRGNFKTPHRLLFLNLDLVHGIYKGDFKGNEVAMSVTELKTYLEQIRPYLGWKKAKKFSRTGSVLKAYVFDLGEVQEDGSMKGGLSSMGISFTLSKIAIEQEDHKTGNGELKMENGAALPEGVGVEVKEDLPF